MGKVTHDNLFYVLDNLILPYEYKAKQRIIEEATGTLMNAILNEVPDCADRTIALRCVREAKMWANAAISLGGEI